MLDSLFPVSYVHRQLTELSDQVLALRQVLAGPWAPITHVQSQYYLGQVAETK